MARKKRLQFIFKFMAFIAVLMAFALLAYNMFFVTQQDTETVKTQYDKDIGGQEDIPELLQDVDVDGVLSEFMSAKPYKVPNVVFYDNEDKEYDFMDYKGNFLIVYFWASWCAACNEELKSLQSLYNDFIYNQNRDITILPISIDYKGIYDVNNFYQSIGIDSISIFSDPGKEVMNAMKVTNLPTSFLINKDGQVIARINKHLDWAHDIIYNELMNMKGADTSLQESKEMLEKLNKKKHEEIDDKKNKSDIITNNTKKKVIMIQ